MSDERLIRLEIVKAVIPQATRVGLNDPDIVVNICTDLEKYVLGSPQAEDLPDSAPRRPGRPRKEKPSSELPGFLDPTHGG